MRGLRWSKLITWRLLAGIFVQPSAYQVHKHILKGGLSLFQRKQASLMAAQCSQDLRQDILSIQNQAQLRVLVQVA
jgi:hypothetical protein